MRTTFVLRLLSLALASTTYAAPTERAAAGVAVAGPELEEAASTEKVNSPGEPTDGGSDSGTTFNGQRVPAVTEIGGSTIDETIGKGYW